MKKANRYLVVCLAACTLLLSGCGTQMYELTAEEEDIIVHYAAYVVAKHNIQQKDGVSNVVVTDEELEDVEENVEPETELGEEVVGGGEDISGETTSETQEVDDTTVSLAEVIGHASDLTVTYTGSYVADNYIEGAAYSVDAATGKTFYVMQFTLTNTTAGDVAVNNAAINPIFKLVSGDVNVKSEVTFLTYDFSTYVGTIPAGQSVETILLFEVNEAQAEGILEPILQITVDNETKNVKL